MNYSIHYKRLIERARNRTLDGYRERHHVVPKCMGGKNDKDNIVELTAEEHYVAHQLLVKIHPENRLLATAAVWMAKQCSGNKAYGWLRRRHADGLRGKKRPPFSDEWKTNISAAQRGKKEFTSEQRRKMSLARLGKKMPLEVRMKISASSTGKLRTDEHREKLRVANIGRKHTPEAKAKVSASLVGNNRSKGNQSFLGRKHSPESIKKMSDAKKGCKRSPEAVAKTAAANRGKKYGPMPIERRQKISASKKGKKLSIETRAKMSAAHLARHQNKYPLVTNDYS